MLNTAPRPDVRSAVLPASMPSPASAYAVAQACYEAGDYEQASEVLAGIVPETPLDADAHKLLGYALYMQAEHALAVPPLCAAMLLDIDDPEPMYMAARCFQTLGQTAMARDLAMQALATSRLSERFTHIGLRVEQLLDAL